MRFDPSVHKIICVHAAEGPERGQHLHLSLPELVGAVNALPEQSVDWQAVQNVISGSYEDLARQNQQLAARVDALERLVNRILDIPIPVDLEVA